MEQNQIGTAPEAPAHESASLPPPAPPTAARAEPVEARVPCAAPPPGPGLPKPGCPPHADDLLGFDPVPLRYRTDGLTPERQRDFVEALADCGLVREAAARIGVSEQAVARVRRRADARAFDLACQAAQRIGARRLHAIAWERAIEGTVKRHYYHGELKSEEVVYDNRLLIYLLGKTAHLVEPPAETQAVLDDWEPWMEAVGQGLPEPPAPAPEPERTEDAPAAADGDEDEDEDEEDFEFDGDEVWKDEDDDIWWTRFPPSADFFGYEEGVPGEEDYKRTLSAAEFEAAEAQAGDERREELLREYARRDAWFGFRGQRFPDEEDAAGDDEADEDDDADDEAGEADDEAGEADDEDGEEAYAEPAPRLVPEWAAARPADPAGGGGVFSSREAGHTETSAAGGPPSRPCLGAGHDDPDGPPGPSRGGPRVRALKYRDRARPFLVAAVFIVAQMLTMSLMVDSALLKSMLSVLGQVPSAAVVGAGFALGAATSWAGWQAGRRPAVPAAPLAQPA